jgi:hypothetical protein
VTGIIGFKGHVHIGFGEELRIESDDPDEVAAQIDRQILLNYRLQDSNYLALELLRERGLADLPPLSAALGEHKVDAASREKFQNRLAAVDPALHRHYLNMYANPAIRRYTSTGAA